MGEHRALLVEDHAGIAELERDALERSGFEIEEARTGQQAIACLERWQQFAVLILDYRLPDMTATEVVAALGERIASLPVIVVTGYPDPKLRDQLLDAGVHELIVKDFDLAFLDELPETALEAIESHREKSAC